MSVDAHLKYNPLPINWYVELQYENSYVVLMTPKNLVLELRTVVTNGGS